MMTEYSLPANIYNYVEQNAIGLEQSIKQREHTIQSASAFLDSDRERLTIMEQWLEEHKDDKVDE